jgi:hypothetical protein
MSLKCINTHSLRSVREKPREPKCDPSSSMENILGVPKIVLLKSIYNPQHPTHWLYLGWFSAGFICFLGLEIRFLLPPIVRRLGPKYAGWTSTGL